MKCAHAILLPACVLAVAITPNHTPAQSAYAVVERAPNYNVWQKTTVENGTNRIRRYVELASGLNVRDAATGRWKPSSETIEVYPGGAIARQGPCQVIFANNLNSAGAIEQQTPDGKRLRSNILGLAYYDSSSGKNVLIAQIQDSQGELISSNQVLYPDAFDGVVKADVRYTYKKGGFEQDVILRTHPPAPESLGLNSQSTEIEALTEFISPPQVKIVEHRLKNNPLPDDDVNWGVMRLGRGRAFDLGEPRNGHSRVMARRQYVTAQGRNILVEGVPIKQIELSLANLPLQSSAATKLPVVASKTLALPKTPLAQADQQPMKLALASPSKKGVVLDYVEMDSDQTDYTFQSGTTYYVSSELGLYGTTTFEGGSVIKFDEQNGGFAVYSAINNSTDPANPTVLTSMNDDSVGEIIDGSTGQPGRDMSDSMDILTNYIELANFRFNHDEVAFFDFVDGSTNIFWNCEFSDCGETIDLTSGSVVLRNVLNCAVNFYGSATDGNGFYDPYSVDAQDVTSTGGGYVVNGGVFVGIGVDAYHETVVATNCILIGAGGDLTYGKDVATNAVFQSAANADYYLAANSPWHNVGTANIDPDLLAEIQTMTTYAPQDGGWPDTGGTDLGYHYPVNEDSDYDGLPDWWEWKWFGSLSQSAADDFYTNEPSELLFDTMASTANGVLPSWRDYRTSPVPDGMALGILIQTNYPFELTKIEVEVVLENLESLLDTDIEVGFFRNTNQFALGMFVDPDYVASGAGDTLSKTWTDLGNGHWLLSVEFPTYGWGTNRVVTIRTVPISDSGTMTKMSIVGSSATIPGIAAYASDNTTTNMIQVALPKMRVWRRILAPTRPPYIPPPDSTALTDLDLSWLPGYQLGVTTDPSLPFDWQTDELHIRATTVDLSEGPHLYLTRPDPTE